MKLLGALALTLALFCSPQTALRAGSAAMRTWATSVAPAVFPFFVVVNALSAPEAARAYERFLGRLLPPLFGCPGACAAPLLVGWLAGSPAGALSCAALAAHTPLTRAQFKRIALLCSGCGPLYLVSGVGAALLGDAQLGVRLALCQLGALFLSGLLLKYAWRKECAPVTLSATDIPAVARPVRDAVSNVLAIAGSMTFYQIVAALLVERLRFLPFPLVGAALELSTGMTALAALDAPLSVRLTLLAACAGFAGACIASQSLAHVKAAGVSLRTYFAGKLLHAALSAALCGASLRLLPVTRASEIAWELPRLLPAGIASALLLPAAGWALAARLRQRQKGRCQI